MTKLSIVSVKIADLRDAPWRFSEDFELGHVYTRQYSGLHQHLVVSLETRGQLSPIHVRPLDGDGKTYAYEIVDGHVVADAARQLGLTELDAVVHDVDDEAARLLYIHFNLNRCGQYGHYHVKIHRVMGQVEGKDAAAKLKKVELCCNWPAARVLDYIELSERDVNWRKFMYAVDEDGNEGQDNIFANEPVEEQLVEDYR